MKETEPKTAPEENEKDTENGTSQDDTKPDPRELAFGEHGDSTATVASGGSK